MLSAKWAAVLGLCLLALTVGGATLIGRDSTSVATKGPRTGVAPRPSLALLTSLPLLFGEEFGLDASPSATGLRLEEAYAVAPIATTDAASLKGQTLLLMAHPRAQPAEMLVALDQWVRRGGRVVLLADPRLDWHSERPLGDPLRPPPDFADTGLLARWGLGLSGPVIDGPQLRRVGEVQVLTASPGSLRATSESCTVRADSLVADCRVGRGRATVVADADFLNVSGEGALDGPTAENLDFLMLLLSRSGGG